MHQFSVGAGTVNFSGIGLDINNTVSSNKVRFVIYENDGSGSTPNTLLFSSANFTLVNGSHYYTINYTEPPGFVPWIGFELFKSANTNLSSLVPSGTLNRTHIFSTADPNPITGFAIYGNVPFEAINFTQPVVNNITPITGTIGDSIFIAINHWQSLGTGYISFANFPDGPLIANSTVNLNSTGGWKGTVLVPPGALNVIAVYDLVNPPINTLFTVLTQILDPAIPVFGGEGSSVFLDFNQFIRNDSATITFGGVPISNATVTLNSTGGWSGFVTVPAGANNGIIVSDGTNTGNIAFAVNGQPYVTDLRYSALSNHSVILTWSTPNLSGFSFLGYQINYTTPFGLPQTILVPNSGSTTTNYNVTLLSPSTDYSFRVGTITTSSDYVNGSNILNVTTLTNSLPITTIGNLNLNVGTNPLQTPFKFTRQDLNSTSLNLYVNYPNTFNTTCNFNYEFANTNQSYSNLATTPNGTGRVYALFQFNGVNSEIINTKCIDNISNTTGRYVITQTNIPLVQQIQGFQAGQFGTAGLFAGFDLVELLILIIAMLGLNRVNETLGTITMLVIIGALAFFHIGSFSTLIVAALSLIILVAIITTRKLAFS